jgi:hypothetical protein
MEGKKIEFYIYAESDKEVEDCRKAIVALIESYRQRGIAVTANKMRQAIDKLNNGNSFVRNAVDKFLIG